MAPKRRKVGAAEAEEEKVDGLSFKWKVHQSRNFEKCSFSVKGAIVLNGDDVGEVEATLVDRTFIREGLEAKPETFPDFQDVCKEIDTEAGDELCDGGGDLLDHTSGKVKYRPVLSSEAWDPSADAGGLLHIYNVRVAEEHRGRALGLRAVRHLLTTRLRGRWTLAITKPTGEPPGSQGPGAVVEAWHRERFLESHGDEAGLAAARRAREGAANAAAEGVGRYFARLGFSQAGPANDGAKWWFLVKATATERTKGEAAALPVALQALHPEFTAAEAKLRELVARRWGGAVGKQELEAFVLRRELDGEVLPEEDGPVDLAKAAPLHAAVAAAEAIGRSLKDRIPALVALGCSPDQRDHIGYTPLHIAAGLLCRVDNQPRAIAALLDAGADASVPCLEGVLPYEEAEGKWPPYYDYLKSLRDRHCNEPNEVDTALRFIQEQAMSFAAAIRLRLGASAGPPPAALHRWYNSTIEGIEAAGVLGPPANAQAVKDFASSAKEAFRQDDEFFKLWQQVPEKRKEFERGLQALPEAALDETFKAYLKEKSEGFQKVLMEGLVEIARDRLYGKWLLIDAGLDQMARAQQELIRKHREEVSKRWGQA